MKIRCLWLGLLMATISCTTRVQDAATVAASFGNDVSFLKKHTEILVLEDKSGKGRVAVSPMLQARGE
ncbi:MAG: DUF6786 family protein [Bacteroidota bacterium]